MLNFESVRFAAGNDLPYELFLLTYTAAAWYHKKLAPDVKGDLKKTLQEVEHWALTGYAGARQGSRSSAAPARSCAAPLSISETSMFDLTAIRPPYTARFNQCARQVQL